VCVCVCVARWLGWEDGKKMGTEDEEEKERVTEVEGKQNEVGTSFILLSYFVALSYAQNHPLLHLL